MGLLSGHVHSGVTLGVVAIRGRHMRLAWLIGWLALQLVDATAPAETQGSCPAGGPGCSAKELKCIKFRQTGGCNPKGPREKHGDKPCSEEIAPGISGFCQCGLGSDKMHAREVTCDHRPFKCETECMLHQRYTCIGWRQTGGCSADGEREPQKDKSCDEVINSRMSGFCECGDGRVVRKPGCSHGENMDDFRCRDVCSHEPDLYEELGLDAGASEQAIKQAFRKMSLKYHPDKTRGDPAQSARFAQIREAYDIIGDAEQRAIYDVAGMKTVIEARGQKVEKGPAMQGNVGVTLEALYNGAEVSTTVQRKVICRGCAQAFTERCKNCRVQCAHEIQLVNVQMGPMVMQQQQQVASKEKCRMESVPLLVHVERGMSSGDTIVFKSKGEQQPKKIPGDVVLKIQEQKHKVFRRTGIDLHTEIDITLKEALLGFERTLKHLDGRTITIGFSGVTKPFGVMKVEGEGMPHRGDPTQRGNLFVKCRFVMPDDGREWLRQEALSG